MSEELHHTIAARLGEAGQRYTSGRRQLVDALVQTHRPLTAAEIVSSHDLAQSSAYRNLALLEECGVVHRVAGSDEFARFELAEDLTDHHHHHLICTSCGTVADFTVSDRLERDLVMASDEVASTTGFTPDHHRLDLLGRCADCA